MFTSNDFTALTNAALCLPIRGTALEHHLDLSRLSRAGAKSPVVSSEYFEIVVTRR